MCGCCVLAVLYEKREVERPIVVRKGQSLRFTEVARRGVACVHVHPPVLVLCFGRRVSGFCEFRHNMTGGKEEGIGMNRRR